MKQWGLATFMYQGDFNDRLPLFGDLSSDYNKPFWHMKLAPYVAKQTQDNKLFTQTEVYSYELRRCPGGSAGPVPFSKPPASSSKEWNCWIGANFGAYGDMLSGPFYYGDRTQPLNIARIKRPADAMAYMDTITHYVYSPVEANYRFTLDMDRDGAVDTMPQYPDVPFNSGRPTVHNNGSNLTLLDGHVERVPFKKLWQIDAAKEGRAFLLVHGGLSGLLGAALRLGAYVFTVASPSPRWRGRGEGKRRFQSKGTKKLHLR